MKIKIDQDGCIECGSCEALCPQVFVIPEREKSRVVEQYAISGHPELGEINSDLESCARDAADSCPVTVIELT